MKNMSLKIKLIGGFALVALITVAIGTIGWKAVADTGAALMEVGEVRLPSLYGLEIINEAQTAIQRAERTLCIPEIFSDPRQVEDQTRRLADAWQRVDQGWKIYEPLPQSKDEEILWKKFTPNWEVWKKDHQQVIDLIKSGKREEALALSIGKARESFGAAEKSMGEVIEIQGKESKHFIKESIGDIDRPKIIMGTSMAVGTLIALFLGIYLSISISRTLIRISQGMSEGADQVSSASAQVSSASQSLAEGTSQQAAAIEESSSSLEEMSSMTKQNADNANQANALMTETRKVVATANDSMARLTESMKEISKASEDTSKIIKTIDEIAFQTNLLALNAAVEAARAGEAGAGFAVVADEVRNLAMRASEAAKNTANLIEGTVKKVKDGSEIVDRTNEAFQQVAASSTKVGQLVSEIAASSNEQAQGIEQINKAVTEMDKVTQQNAANAEESASASEEMNAQAEQMKGMVDELVVMVSGSSNSNGRSHAAPLKAKQLQTGRSRAGRSQRALTLHHGPLKQTAAAKITREQRNPAEVIPMEEDFKDF